MIALAGIVLAQENSKREDPGGWNAAKWGMTEAELLKAFEGKAIPSAETSVPTQRSIPGIKSWSIGATDYEVLFLLNDEGKLRMVQISPHAIKDSGGRPQSPPVFDVLNTMLVEKYGKADSETSGIEEQRQTRTRVWVLPTTVIELRSMTHLRFGFNSVTLTYRKKDKAALDAL